MRANEASGPGLAGAEESGKGGSEAEAVGVGSVGLPAADVAEGYRATAALPDRSIAPARSAQQLLGVTPRSTSQWLADIGLE